MLEIRFSILRILEISNPPPQQLPRNQVVTSSTIISRPTCPTRPTCLTCPTRPTPPKPPVSLTCWPVGSLTFFQKMAIFWKNTPEKFVDSEKSSTFASQLSDRAFSSAGSEHLPYKQRVGGSNPSTPTTQETRLTSRVFFYPPSPIISPTRPKEIHQCLWK